ncbi:MAG: PilT/PilU family type 4a pilus ATPase [Victivallales bacterium]|nr:PilT/PilU family type 4a pilus ATPase [Victivallales bacterium]
MPSVIHDLLAAFVENEAVELHIRENKPATLRINGEQAEIETWVLDSEQFLQVASELLPEKEIQKFVSGDEGGAFVNENSLLVEEDLGRFLINLQRQRGQLELFIRRPRRDASIMFEALKYAVDNGASDLHIREGKYIRLRLHAQLVDTDIMTDENYFKKSYEDIVPPGKMEEYKETGDLDFAWEEEGIGRFRVNLHRQRGMSAYTLRHVKGKPPTVREVNLPEIIKTICDDSHNGIIFISGTTGSGKSTTMAAMLDHINNTQEKHIITIEDPIEYTFQDNRCFFEQREVGLDAISFSSALKHALRQDPDIIMVGEMRSRDTFETAIGAAETGHLVITTLHTKDAAQSITRILDMFPLEERDTVRKNLAGCLRAIICQRLAPRATGKGVVPINEILINTPIVSKMMFDGKLDKIHQCIEAGERDGMMSFNQCLLKLVNNGDITEECAMNFSDSPEQLKMGLKGIILSTSGVIN